MIFQFHLIILLNFLRKKKSVKGQDLVFIPKAQIIHSSLYLTVEFFCLFLLINQVQSTQKADDLSLVGTGKSEQTFPP